VKFFGGSGLGHEGSVLARIAAEAAPTGVLLCVLALLAGCASEARPPSAEHRLGIHPAHTASADGLQAMTDRHSGVRLWVAPQPALTEADVQLAEMAFTPAGEPAVVLTLSDKGRATLAELTRQYLGQPLALVVDGELRLAPIIEEPVLDGRVALTGFDSLQEAEALVRDWSR
jgi:preprotein translocase subunit SecD